MHRVTQENIKTLVNVINTNSKDNGVVVEYSNGMAQLYLVNKKEYKNNYTLRSHLVSGTKREIYDRLQAMDWVWMYLLKEE